MSKTADNLVYEVAAILGKAVAGEALGQPEYDTIDNNIDPVLAEIENIVYVGDRDNAPLRSGGALRDVAPTLLDLLGLPQPPEMTGRSLFDRAQ